MTQAKTLKELLQPVVFAERGRCTTCLAQIPPYGPDAPFGEIPKNPATRCQGCGSPIRRWKRPVKDAATCDTCGRLVPEASSTAAPVRCGLCLSRAADLVAMGLLGKPQTDRECNDCKKPVPPRRRYCNRCRERHRREASRRTRARMSGATQLTPNRPEQPIVT